MNKFKNKAHEKARSGVKKTKTAELPTHSGDTQATVAMRSLFIDALDTPCKLHLRVRNDAVEAAKATRIRDHR